MELKQYQTDTLGALRHFFEESRMGGPKNSYESFTQEPEQAGRLGPYGGAYQPLKGLPEVPYVCLRLPTGGGKTILAAHAVSIVRDAWIEKDWPMALWLVPTNTIRRQTAEALKNHRHAYRRVLDEAFSGRVRVFDIADFTHIRPHDIRENCCIVVGTIQTLRTRSTEGRKVYGHNENLEAHFSKLAAHPPGLEEAPNGGPKFSFANLMHLQRPLMIVDEAHNAVTGLTREMQARVNPCAIVEFTATPRTHSNILHSVTASELKTEEMVKLPVMLSEYDTWQNAVNGAVAARMSLAETAADDPDHIRPIVLFQAQKKNGEVPAAALKRHLIEVEQIPEDRIAIATGDQRGLDGIDLFDPDCPIEHVITVEALKEGWDCSFAYVFCSVSRIQSAKDAEQLLGRVLRMPYAKRRKTDALNRAYAHLSEPSFGAAAKALVDKLIAMGFDEEEARESIERMQAETDDADNDLFSRRNEILPVFTYALPEGRGLVSQLEALDGLLVRDADDGGVEIRIRGHLDAKTERAIAELLPTRERKALTKAAAAYRSTTDTVLSPAQRGESFALPRLMAEVQGVIEFADTDILMESHDWSLRNHPWRPGEGEFNVRETSRSFEIDLDGNRIAYQFASEEEQLALDVEVEGWTPEALVLWLDRHVRQPDIGQSDLVGWLSSLVNHLAVSRGMPIAALMRCKFILARSVRDRLAAIRTIERKCVYQRHLFEPGAKPEISFDHAFSFKDGMYRGQQRYRGRWKPLKHFLGPDCVPDFDGAEGGEEFRCAQEIDRLPGLKFWLRNVARHRDSFWLPTAAGRFYPDFVAMLEDGRLLVVEYKGGHIAESAATAEKRNVGALWERESNGKCVFVMAEKSVNGEDARSQILAKLAPRSI
ncbi:MAG: restriction endonuclease subunit R [Gammaproteobacteria bacterium]|nr:restriction endonuclease subunit R [Gammaproteobacteria bacterium]MYD01053.1 restriction endonuclease subunit R [Gammaproteobacteria bacterium]MYI23939.1 restriction endonuclease subunit R [Gammaproteobacteria bacterium]